ncbi:MAG: chloride channel protein [Cyclobacteriaceae bacterium]|nr:chloride channel protein [Cyclobacteriaceae bacterium]
MKSNQFLLNFLIWRVKHIKTQNFTMILSIIIGAIAGLAAVTLKETVHLIQHFLFKSDHAAVNNYLIYFYPMIGIIITVLITRYYWKEKLGHGVTDILFSISQKSSIIRKGKMYSRMLTSAITVGFGGSVGLEAPIVVTGSAIGSNIARLMHLDYKNRTILIGCGAAGAIAGIFNSPITGVIFSSEVILAGLGFASFIPLLIAAVCGSLVSMYLHGDDILFSFILKDPFIASHTPYFILLGVLSGLISLYFTRFTYFVDEKITKIKNYLVRGIIGGLLLAIIIFFFPPIYGEGYDTIKLLLNSNESEIAFQSFFSFDYSNPLMFLLFLVGVILFKPIASSLTIESGGSGGIFAPSLFLGGVVGFVFAFTINYFYPGTISLSNFTLVGMCGVMSGVLHAPLTAIFLIAEITGGYTLFVPLMIVSAISFSTISYFEKYSIYTKRLIERGEYIPHDKDKQLLSGIKLKKVIEKDLVSIKPYQNLNDLVKVVRKSKRNLFPVVDDEGQLVGIITLDDIRDIMFDEVSRNEIQVSSIMNNPPASISSKDSMQSVMNTFEISGAWNLPVIDKGKYIGFVSKSRIFNTYRTKLKKDRAE